MRYSIGQVSKMFDIPISTLRYYDKEGLFKDLQRTSGILQFSEKELDTLRVIDCLKKSGLEIRDIKVFMDWCAEGKDSYPQRLALFQHQKAEVEAEMARLERTLAMLRYKCWYYETAISDGSEEGIRAMLPDRLPAQVQALFDKAHEE